MSSNITSLFFIDLLKIKERRMSLFKDFIIFLKRPKNDNQPKIISIVSSIKVCFYTILIMVLIDLVAGVIILPLKILNLIPNLKDFHYTVFNIIRITFVLPLIEELIFRLPLKITKINLIVFISMVFFILFYRFNLLFTLIISFLIILFGLLFLDKNSKFLLFVKHVLNSNFLIVFYLQAVIFGGLHLLNYDLDLNKILIYPFIIISQVLTGLFLGFIRIRYLYGIFICIFSHMLLNSLYCIILAT